jgi:hypothetical protein
MERKQVSTRTRFEVFKRDKFTCQYCGRTPPTVILHVDHIVAVANGGTGDPLNLITACADCNLGKAAVPLGQVHRPIAEQIAEAEERKAQVEAFNAFLMEARDEETRQVEEVGRYWYNKFAKTPEERDEWCFGPGRIPSIRTFVRRLPLAEIFDAIDIAEDRIFAIDSGSDYKRFKYFCGVCWHKIRDHENPPAVGSDG